MPLEDDFPDLAACGFTVTDAATIDYNCIAWAAGDKTRWWEPCHGYYWPDGVPRDYTVTTLTQMFGSLLGYSQAANPAHEAGVEKVAVYAIDPDIWEHAARQLESGRWTSKIGQNVQIEHGTLEGLYNGKPGSQYGKVVANVKRHRQ